MVHGPISLICEQAPVGLRIVEPRPAADDLAGAADHRDRPPGAQVH